ncbi:hypothetical protein [Nocardioides caricicola]|uniref:DUF4143 domain-containing protein n=1 Tax=Nocardioides caricicola TaxID=634770 RepID=A0ABW0MXW9_9ACTN
MPATTGGLAMPTSGTDSGSDHPSRNLQTSTHASARDLDADPGVDATVPDIEHLFDAGGATVLPFQKDNRTAPKGAAWHGETDSNRFRSPARPSTGITSPAAVASPNTERSAGRGSLGVLMPTLLSTNAVFTGRRASDLGSLTHLLVGSHVQFISLSLDGTGVPVDLLDRMYAVAYAVIDANPNARRVLATEAASLALRYLTEFPPAAPWRLLGVEYDTGNGRVDLAWWNGDTCEVFFDEVKTSRVSGRQVSPAWLDQSRRYSAAGAARFGESFLGTRLVPLTTSGTVHLVREGEPIVALSPIHSAPLQCTAPVGSGC